MSPRGARRAACAGLLLALSVSATACTSSGGGGRSGGASGTSGPASPGATSGAGVSSPAAGTTSAAGSPSGATRSPSGVLQTVPSGTIVTAPPRPLTSPAPLGGGVVVKVKRTDSFYAQARVPGDISGPAVAFTLRLTNRSASAVSLAGVAVTVSYGTDDTPASSIQVDRSRPFTGSVAAGRSATGVYVFGIPTDQRRHVVVTFTLDVKHPVILLQGPTS